MDQLAHIKKSLDETQELIADAKRELQTVLVLLHSQNQQLLQIGRRVDAWPKELRRALAADNPIRP